jgi:hypothetical protein
MKLEALFQAIHEAQQVNQGRVPGIQYGVVIDNQDPLGLGRVKCIDATKGGKTTTDWLFRILPLPGFTPPLPSVGDTVLMGFIENDPHRGVYLGSLQNLVNPSLNTGQALTLKIGDVIVNIDPSGAVVIGGATGLQINSSNVEFIGASSVTINGKEIVTLGGRDTRGDTINQKGW